MTYATLMVSLALDQPNDSRLQVAGELAETASAATAGARAPSIDATTAAASATDASIFSIPAEPNAANHETMQLDRTTVPPNAAARTRREFTIPASTGSLGSQIAACDDAIIRSGRGRAMANEG